MGWMGIAANSNNRTVFIPAGAWEDAGAIARVRGWGEMRGATGEITATPAVQLSNDPRNPPATATAVGATLSADGVSDPTGATALATGAFRFIRPGWNVKLSSGTTLATATVAGAVQFITS
jgi:hypothetical protein